MLNQPLDIPVIGALYKFLFHEDLTVLHLNALLIAVPLTILYKLMNDRKAPFSGVDAEALRTLSRQPPGADPSLPITAQEWKDIYLAVGLVNAVVVAIGDGLTIVQGPEGSESGEGGSLGGLGQFITLLGDCLTVVMQVSSWPAALGEFPNANLGPVTAAEGWALGNWLSYWAQPGFDFSMVGVNLPAELTCGVSTVFGTAAMITAIVAIEIGKDAEPPLDGAGIAEFAISPLGLLMTWVLLPEIRIPLYDSTDELGYGLDTAGPRPSSTPASISRSRSSTKEA